MGLDTSLKERTKRFAIGVPIFLGVYIVLILLYIHPHWPIDLVGWLILIVVGIPISLCLEWIGESVFSDKVGLKISSEKFSIKRIVFSLFVSAVIVGALVLLWLVFGSFIRHHFG